MHFFMFRWILFKWIPRGFEKKRKSINCKSGSRQLCSELPLHFRSNDVQQSLAVPLPLPQGRYSFWVLIGTAKDCCTFIRPRGWEFTAYLPTDKGKVFTVTLRKFYYGNDYWASGARDCNVQWLDFWSLVLWQYNTIKTVSKALFEYQNMWHLKTASLFWEWSDSIPCWNHTECVKHKVAAAYPFILYVLPWRRSKSSQPKRRARWAFGVSNGRKDDEKKFLHVEQLAN